MNYSYTDKMDYVVTNLPAVREDSYEGINTALRYQLPSSNWQFSVWVKNLADEQYGRFRLDFSTWGVADPATSIIQAPQRLAGVSARYSY